MIASKPRVSLDVTAIPAQIAGAGRYVFELTRYLGSSDDLDLSLIARSKDAQRWQDLNKSVVSGAPESRPLRLAWEQLKMPSVVNELGVDLHHGPHYTLPRRASVRKVVTIHDMTFFEFPQWHEKAKVQFFTRAIESSVKQATEIVSVSHYTAGRIKDHFGDLPVTVIPHGVDHTRFVPDSADSDNDLALLAAAGIEGEFVAFVGTVEPRKDVPSLVAAFEAIAAKYPSVKLVIAGRRGWGTDDVSTLMASSRFADRILRVGYLADQAIPALLRQARVVAYPSLVEGFGLPALEALACGAVLITTRGSAMEEVVGNAAVLVDTDNIDQLSAALDSALAGHHEELRVMGPQVASQFTWQACGQAHVELYKKALLQRA